jgi:hypothetical protein
MVAVTYVGTDSWFWKETTDCTSLSKVGFVLVSGNQPLSPVSFIVSHVGPSLNTRQFLSKYNLLLRIKYVDISRFKQIKVLHGITELQSTQKNLCRWTVLKINK